MRVDLYIDGQLLDQYKDESVDIVSSVLDVEDITKNTGDYSKNFSVPGSKSNNKIFSHWYNVSIDNGFDSRTKVKGHIEIDGILFKTGKWRLNSCTGTKGNAVNYKINFFGDTASIKDIIGKDRLKDLNFNSYDHDHTASKVRVGLTSGLFDKDIIYTPMAAKRYFYDPNAFTLAGDIGEERVNIAWNGAPDGRYGTGSGIVWKDLRPSIKCLRIIDAIESKYAGAFQVTGLIINDIPTSGGSTTLTLDGVEHLILINGGFGVTKTDVANELITAINLIDDYSALLSTTNNVVIFAQTKGRQLATTFNNGAADGLQIDVLTGFGEADKNLKFSRDFFQTTEFEQMYMWLNPDTDSEDGFISRKRNIIEFDTNVSGNNIDLFSNIGLYPMEGVRPDTVKFQFKLELDVASADQNKQYDVVMVDIGGNELGRNQSISGDSVSEFEIRHYSFDDKNFNVGFYIESSSEITFEPELTQKYITIVDDGQGVPPVTTIATGSSQTADSGVVISDIMPDMPIMEFIKGISQMFKLVMIGQEDGSIYVNTLDSYYSQGNRYDISKYVDQSTFEINRGEILSEIEFAFEDPSTILAKEFKERFAEGYGSQKVTLEDEEEAVLDGDKLEVELPFEQIVYERLSNKQSNDLTNIQVASIIDHDLSPANPKIHLHYAEQISLSSNPVKFNNWDDLDDDTYTPSITILDSKMFMPFHHLGVTNPVYALLFENENSTYTASRLSPINDNGVIQEENNLYSIHYRDYVNAIFELNRRTFQYNANLPVHIITKLDLNDVLTIDGLDYRINKYSYNLLTGKTQLELINGFDTNLDKGVYLPTRLAVGREGGSYHFNVPNISEYTVTKVSQGSGTSWLSTNTINSDNDNILTIQLGYWSYSSNDVYRAIEVKLERNGVTTSIMISQENYNNTIN